MPFTWLKTAKKAENATHQTFGFQGFCSFLLSRRIPNATYNG